MGPLLPPYRLFAVGLPLLRGISILANAALIVESRQLVLRQAEAGPDERFSLAVGSRHVGPGADALDIWPHRSIRWRTVYGARTPATKPPPSAPAERRQTSILVRIHPLLRVKPEASAIWLPRSGSGGQSGKARI
jgi:hypothetical protein